MNVSEGSDEVLLRLLGRACGDTLLDVHRDPGHHRAVFTLAGSGADVEHSVRSLAAAAVTHLDLRRHHGAHPRFGVVDVVPFVPLEAIPASLEAATGARDRFATWAATELQLPSFLYGPLDVGVGRSLPEVRRHAFQTLSPDAGPPAPHPTAGACAVGARPVLVAYNLWVSGDVALARNVAAQLRAPAVRALGLYVGSGIQVSCNLVDPLAVGPADVYDAALPLLEAAGATVTRCELVGLIPAAVLGAVPERRWPELGLDPDHTIESRLEGRGTAAVSWR